MTDRIVITTSTATSDADIAAGIAVGTEVPVEKGGETDRHEEHLRVRKRDLLATRGDKGAAAGTTNGMRGEAIVSEAGAAKGGATTDNAVGAETDIGVDLPREGGAQAQDCLGGELMARKALEVNG